MNRKIIFAFCIFIFITAMGLSFAVYITGRSLQAFWQIPHLNTSFWILLMALSILVYVAETWRTKVCAQALGLHSTWATCFEVAVVGLFFAWLTPGGALGAPAAAYIFHKRAKMDWDAALLLTFGKAIIGVAFLFVLAFLCIILGLGPQMNQSIILYPLIAGVAAYGCIIILSLLGALFPQVALTNLDTLEKQNIFGIGLSKPVSFFKKIVIRLQLFLKNGKNSFFTLLLSNLFYFAAFILIATAVGFEMGGRPFLKVLGISTVKTAATYVAPTPGGAGLSEATAVAFYGALMPPTRAVSVVLIFRAFTFYTQILVGLLYFAVVGGLNQTFSAAEKIKRLRKSQV